jgi:hypothetical protein
MGAADIAFAERAAIMQFDGGLSRADAERQALVEIYDMCMSTIPPGVGVLGELLMADRQRRNPALAPSLEAMGLGHMRLPWGFAHIVREGRTHRPADLGEMGTAAVIVPATMDGALVDLVADDLTTGAISTRLDVANVIGADWIERARSAGAPLYIFSTVSRWLRGGGIGVVVVDWKHIASELDGIAAILCSPEIAGRLQRATARSIPRPFVAVPNAKGAAHAA